MNRVGDNEVIVWDAAHRRMAYRLFALYPHPVEFSPDGSLLAVESSSHLRVWNTADGSLRFEVPEAETFFGQDESITKLGFTPDGSAHFLAFAPDRRSIAASGRDEITLSGFGEGAGRGTNRLPLPRYGSV